MTAEFYKGMALGAVAMFWLMAVVIVLVGRRKVEKRDLRPAANPPIVGERRQLLNDTAVATVLAVEGDGTVIYHLNPTFPHNRLDAKTFRYCYPHRVVQAT